MRQLRTTWPLVAATVVLLLAGCGAMAIGRAGAPTAPAPDAPRPVPCGLWLAIGDRPSDDELRAAVGRYRVVVLNAWDTAVMQRLRVLDPTMTLLVYKDLASTRSYPGAVVDGADAGFLPTGVGYVAAQQHPGWFATDTGGQRVEWRTYPGHWQMAVWDPEYQRSWADAVAHETAEQGWDGVFADNDLAELRFYTPAVLAGTSSATGTDELLRHGLDSMITTAGEALRARNKIMVPNVSAARLFPGRWASHGRFGGAMDEHFAFFGEIDGTGTALTGAEWVTQSDQVAAGEGLNLLATRAGPTDLRAQRYGYLSAAVRAEGEVCWTMNTTGDYRQPEWSGEQAVDLGAPVEAGQRQDSGVWTRRFSRAWVVVNPTTASVSVPSPDGTGEAVTVPATDAAVVGRVNSP